MRKILVCLFGFALLAAGQQQPAASPGAASFATRCSVCHGADGNGNERAPAILGFVGSNSDERVAALIRSGVRAMPPHTIADGEMKELVSFLRTLRAPAAAGGRGGRGGAPGPRPGRVTLSGGKALQGMIQNESAFDMQLQTADSKIHLLTRDGDTFSEAPLLPKMDWPAYDGGYTGNRYSPLDQINLTTVKRLAPKWMFPVPGAPRLEATPVVEDGVMYVTASNEVYALDAATGRQIWVYRRPRTQGLLGEAAGGANRGVALSPGRVFMTTDHAHLLSLDRASGKLVWDVELGDYKQEQYNATGAPLVVGDMVIAGVAGGEEGARGLLDAYKISNGERMWRFWTIPVPGEKLAETWIGNALRHGCGATWMTGAYDAALDLLYWTVGNPCPDYNGDDRLGDNLYANSVLALRPKTGELKWYFQFTPHDTHDWDAEEPTLLIDEPFQGRPRKLLAQANRNGFFYLLDRETGEFLLGTPFVKGLSWASGLDKKGRPILNPGSEPTIEGTRVCPGSGTNWMSASYNPAAKLMYVMASDSCSVVRKIPGPWELGKRYFNGGGAGEPGGKRYVRALDIQTGRTAWELEQTGGRSSSGTMSTGGGLVFFGEGSGALAALDAKTGKAVWHFQANQAWRASPMTYMVGGKQYVAIAGPSGYFAFALAD
jgi:alcohol dehydrogenase (cytochrome c)